MPSAASCPISCETVDHSTCGLTLAAPTAITAAPLTPLAGELA